MSSEPFSNKGIDKSKIPSTKKSEKRTHSFKRHRWTANGNSSGIEISLVADDVAVFDDDEKILDELIWKNRIEKIFNSVDESIKTDSSTYCPKPATVEIHFKSKFVPTEPATSEKDSSTTDDTKDVVVIREPRWNFSDVYIAPRIITEINRSLLIARHREKLFSEWKLGNGQDSGRAVVFNFYGPSGTGKSMTGEAIAAKLGKKIYSVNYSELESKYVGETPKNIVEVFRKAQAENAVLIFDEADSFLGKRLTNVTQSADYGVNITRSVMLLELEKFDGIVIFTTNLVTNYDEAFKRRILTSIKFDLPDEKARCEIWKIYLHRGVPLHKELTAEFLAKKYDNISGADIKDMLLYAAICALCRDESTPLIESEDFDAAFDMILNRRNDPMPSVKVVHETISAAQYKLETGEK